MKPRLLDSKVGINRFRCRSEGEIRGAKGWLCGYGSTAAEAYKNWVSRVEKFEKQKQIASQRLKNLQRFDQWVPDDKLVGVGPVRKALAGLKARIFGEVK